MLTCKVGENIINTIDYTDDRGFEGYIYCITNLINNKKYIGQTTRNIEKRWKEHLQNLKIKNKLYNAINKYGYENFSIESIHFIKEANRLDLKESLDKYEIFYIKTFNTYKKGYNSTEGGGGVLGIKYSNESRLKMSISASKRKLSKEARNRRSIAFSGDKNPNFGRQFSVEHIKKLGEAKTRERHWAFGKHLSDETKNKISESHIGLKHTEESKIKIGDASKKPVIQTNKDYSFIAEYNSAVDAYKNTGVFNTNISQCCRNERKTAGGFCWFFKEDYILLDRSVDHQ